MAIVSLLLVMTVLFCGNVFARGEKGERDNWVTPTTSAENPNNYFEFTPSKERVDVNGNFNFNIYNKMDSNKFTLSTSITSISISADIINPNGKEVNDDYKGHVYAVDLRTGAGFLVGTREFTIGGTETAMFYGLSANKEYYIQVRNPTSLPVGWTVKGSGTLSNISSIL